VAPSVEVVVVEAKEGRVMNMRKLAGTSASVPGLAVHEGLRGRSVHSVGVADVKERLIAARLYGKDLR
jgi:hypothetical protein